MGLVNMTIKSHQKLSYLPVFGKNLHPGELRRNDITGLAPNFPVR